MKDAVIRFSDRVNLFLEIVGCILLGSIVICIGTQVVARYVFNAPLPWSEELGRVIFSWIVFIGTSIGVKRGAHMGMHFIVELAHPKVRAFVAKTAPLLGAIFFLIVLIEGIKVAYQVSSGETPAMEISQAWQYSAIPVGAFFALLHIPAILLQDKRPGEIVNDINISM
jgi:TRAP-type C4-dicarboxylate transport system permease small subunit